MDIPKDVKSRLEDEIYWMKTLLNVRNHLLQWGCMFVCVCDVIVKLSGLIIKCARSLQLIKYAMW